MFRLHEHVLCKSFGNVCATLVYIVADIESCCTVYWWSTCSADKKKTTAAAEARGFSDDAELDSLHSSDSASVHASQLFADTAIKFPLHSCFFSKSLMY